MKIINFMPVYRETPVSLHLLEADVDAAAAKLASESASEKIAVLLPVGKTDLAAALAKGAGDNVDILMQDDSFGFVYTNDSAASKTLKGYMPVPGNVNGSSDNELVSGEAWLGGADKNVWLDGAAAPVAVQPATTTSAVLAALGVEADGLKAVYFGYPMSTFVVPANFDDAIEVTCDYVRTYNAKNCMATALKAITNRFESESCGRCVFGHEGGYQLNVVADKICAGKGSAADVTLVRDVAPVMAAQSLCEVGRVMATTVLSAFDLFGDEIALHYTKKTCPAGECSSFSTFHILPTKCVGCGDCVDACEEDAIMGKPRFIHVIDQKACTQCGACVSSCDEEAIIMAGADKPKCPPRPIPVRKR